MDQQEQTKDYFERFAADWQRKSTAEQTFATIRARNQAVLHVVSSKRGVRDFLDVGCGTGQLVIEAARRGVRSTGLDFAADMIAQCEANRSNAQVQAEFITASFFDFADSAASYDVISAQGFIEYISLEQLDDFLRRAFAMLRPGGALVVGSRNRLFNVISLNAFTQMEIKLGTIGRLIEESIVWRLSLSQEAAFEALRPFEDIDPQPDSHPATNIEVSVRYQFAPSDLVARGRQHGFVPNMLFPIHYHGIPVKISDDHPRMHLELATIIDRVAPLDQRLAPYSSSFVLDLRKSP
jgi:2-polyprenyl-3-methyl-5-hydroxy-6-metoxy-1,4-benzoquinol methylase